MTIYHYAPNRGYLHALVVDDILSEIRVPRTDEGNWEDRLREILHDARRVFAQHPGVSAHLGDGGSAGGRSTRGGRSGRSWPTADSARRALSSALQRCSRS